MPIPSLPGVETLLRHLDLFRRLAGDGASRVAGALRDGTAVSHDWLEELGSEAASRLDADGLLVPAGAGGQRFTIRLREAFGRLFLIDNEAVEPPVPGRMTYFDAEGHDFVRHILAREPDRPWMSILDTCTGSGLVGIALWKAGCSLALADVAPRCRDLARVNAALNGIDAESGAGPLLAGVRGPFDLVTANTDYQFLTTEAAAERARRGLATPDGATFGLEQARDILRGLPAILAPSGRACLYTQAFETRSGNTLRDLLTREPPDGLEVECEEVRIADLSPSIPREIRGEPILRRAHVIVRATQGTGRWRYRSMTAWRRRVGRFTRRR